jgi:hypothetical protein
MSSWGQDPPWPRMTRANRPPQRAGRSSPGFWPIRLLRSKCWSSWWAWRWRSATAVTAIPPTDGAARTPGRAGPRPTPEVVRVRRLRHRPVKRPGGPCTPMTTPAGPGGPDRTPCTPTTPAGPGARTHAGPLPKRRYGRTTTPAGPQRTPRPGATPNRRLTVAGLAGPAAAVPPRDGNRRAGLVAYRSRRRCHQCRRRGRPGSGATSLLRPMLPPGLPSRLARGRPG